MKEEGRPGLHLKLWQWGGQTTWVGTLQEGGECLDLESDLVAGHVSVELGSWIFHYCLASPLQCVWGVFCLHNSNGSKTHNSEEKGNRNY